VKKVEPSSDLQGGSYTEAFGRADIQSRLHHRFGVNAVAIRVDGSRRSGADALWANEICRRMLTGSA